MMMRQYRYNDTYCLLYDAYCCIAMNVVLVSTPLELWMGSGSHRFTSLRPFTKALVRSFHGVL